MTSAEPTALTSQMTFAEMVASLRSRAMTNEGNFRQALSCLTAAESLERQAMQLRIQRDAIKAQNKAQKVGGSRIGVRMSHLAHAIMRTNKDRDRYLSQVEAALAQADYK